MHRTDQHKTHHGLEQGNLLMKFQQYRADYLNGKQQQAYPTNQDVYE